jgi:hypothetical protein
MYILYLFAFVWLPRRRGRALIFIEVVFILLEFEDDGLEGLHLHLLNIELLYFEV